MASQCAPCREGHACGVGASHETACSAGTVANATGMAACVKCEAGSYQGEEAQSACVGCTGGSYCPSGASSPLPCPSGRYQNATLTSLGVAMTRAADCVECPAGSACATGAAEPGACAPGSYARAPAMATCARCEAGSYQDEPGQTACTTCIESSWCGEGSSAPTPCAAGTVGRGEGLRRADACDDCPAGSWCSGGKEIPCAERTWSDTTRETSMGACRACPTHATSLAGAASLLGGCRCEAGYYNALPVGSHDIECVTCVTGSDCPDAPGVTIETLPLLTGYYRISNASADLRRCPDATKGNASGCPGGVGVGEGEGPCKPWLTGPYCRLCNVSDTSRYYDAVASACLPCEATSAARPLAVGGGALLVLLAALLLLRRFKPLRRCAPRLATRLRRLYLQLSLRAKFKQALGFYQVVIPLPPSPATCFYPSLPAPPRASPPGYPPATCLLPLVTPATCFSPSPHACYVLVPPLQITTRVAEVYDVPMPTAVADLLAMFEVFNVNISGIGLPLQCLNLGTYEQQLTVTMLVRRGSASHLPLRGRGLGAPPRQTQQFRRV